MHALLQRQELRLHGRKDALFLFEEPGAWTRYRCEHGAEQLRMRGATCDVANLTRVALTNAVDHYDAFVLNRVQWSEQVATFLELARDRGKALVFDTDDLLFEPQLETHFAVFAGWPEAALRAEMEKLERYRSTLEACRAATVSTGPLAEYAGRRVECVEVSYNVVSREMEGLADQALRTRRRKSREIVLAYLSGTRTHDRDFLVAADAVLSALRMSANVHFAAVGKLTLDERFDAFGERVERIPLQPWRVLPHLLHRIDVNLAPLEPGNPVTDCKSCVKYLEAGLVGVPTIASRRADFARAIADGENGLLADTACEWTEALGRLVESEEQRRTIGSAAAEDVRTSHTTRARATAYGEAFERVRRASQRGFEGT